MLNYIFWYPTFILCIRIFEAFNRDIANKRLILLYYSDIFVERSKWNIRNLIQLNHYLCIRIFEY